MSIGQYILDENGKPKPCDDLYEWGRWMEVGKRIVKQDRLPGGVMVSTVFLGLDHSFTPGSKPVLWESMVFGGVSDQYQDRYTSREEAEIGHAEALKLARSGKWGVVVTTILNYLILWWKICKRFGRGLTGKFRKKQPLLKWP